MAHPKSKSDPRKSRTIKTPWESYNPVNKPEEKSGLQSLYEYASNYFGYPVEPPPPPAPRANVRMTTIPNKEYVDYAMEEEGYNFWNQHSEDLKGNKKQWISNIDLVKDPYKDFPELHMAMNAEYKKPNDKILDYIQRSYLSSTELPVAELGFDMDRTQINAQKEMLSTGGTYLEDADQISIYNMSHSDSNIYLAHEATHRGIQQLYERGHDLDINDSEEEVLVRYMLKDKLGPDYRTNMIEKMPDDIKKDYLKLLKRDDLDELVKEINTQAALENGKDYSEWAGAMD